jgi:hypothetical protein
MGIKSMTNQPAVASPYYSQPESSGLSGRWMAVFLVVYGIWIFLPWLAPVLMHAGLGGAGSVLYTIYSFFCH